MFFRQLRNDALFVGYVLTVCIEKYQPDTQP